MPPNAGARDGLMDDALARVGVSPLLPLPPLAATASAKERFFFLFPISPGQADGRERRSAATGLRKPSDGGSGAAGVSWVM